MIDRFKALVGVGSLVRKLGLRELALGPREFVFGLCALGLVATPVLAQPASPVSTLTVEAKPDPTTIAAARALAVQGVRLARAGQCAEAVDKLERAEALRHSIVVAEQLGECYVEQGRLVE